MFAQGYYRQKLVSEDQFDVARVPTPGARSTSSQRHFSWADAILSETPQIVRVLAYAKFLIVLIVDRRAQRERASGLTLIFWIKVVKHSSHFQIRNPYLFNSVTIFYILDEFESDSGSREDTYWDANHWVSLLHINPANNKGTDYRTKIGFQGSSPGIPSLWLGIIRAIPPG